MFFDYLLRKATPGDSEGHGELSLLTTTLGRAHQVVKHVAQSYAASSGASAASKG